MFKFLRKYNKLILAVGGVLLMITFLIPQAFKGTRDAGQHNVTIGTFANGDKMTGADLARAQAELQVLERTPYGGVPGLGRIDRPEHWYLLVHEAEKAGLVPTPNADQFEAETLAAIGGGEHNSQAIAEALAHLQGVARLVGLYQTNGLYSDRRLKTVAERMLRSVRADMVVIEAKAEAGDPEPDEAAIKAQLDKYADVLSGTPDSPFGYKVPDQFKLEWLKIPVESVREIVRASPEFDTIHQRQHWKKNESKTFPPLDAAQAVPDIVREDLLNKLTKQKTDEISRFVVDLFRQNRRALEEKDGFIVLPADWKQKMLDFQKVAADVQAKFPGIALPSYEAIGDRWLVVADLNKIEGIGEARNDKSGGRPMSTGQLVAAAKEFGGSPATPVQQDISGPPVADNQGSLYFFRLIATQPSHKPASVDEVRGKVVDDLKRIAKFEKLEAQAAEIERLAEKDGLLSVAINFNTIVQPETSVYLTQPFFLQQRFQSNMDFGRICSPLPVIGMHRPTVEKLVDYSLTLPKPVPANTLPDSARITVVPDKDHLSLVVAKINASKPLTQEMYEQLAAQNLITQLVMSEEPGSADAIKDAFSLKALEKRNSFTMARDSEKDKDAESAPPAGASAGVN